MELRKYQIEIAEKAVEVLNNLKIVYLACEVRTGKTLMSLKTADNFGAKKVLFLTKKKAIDSIFNDYEEFNFNFMLRVINDESMHNILEDDYDLIIHDEHHRFGAFPKPNKIAKSFKERFGHLPMIFLSGTPTPESNSQWFHQFWVSENSPFKEYSNFYKWCNDGFVDIKIKYLGYAQVKDYSNGLIEKINPFVKPYLISFTQNEAGFTTSVNETILECEMKPITYKIVERLHRDYVVISKSGKEIIADTGAKLQQKTQQIFSGTVKHDDGTFTIIDDSKAILIKEKFKHNKIAIFYKFVAEFECLKLILGNKLTNDLNEFNSNKNKWIALQIVSGREGISLKEADYLVYYSIDFSAVSYWQSRDRLTTMERKSNEIYWIFAKEGIEHKIYKTVLDKKDYTLNIFKKDYGISNKNKNVLQKRRI